MLNTTSLCEDEMSPGYIRNYFSSYLILHEFGLRLPHLLDDHSSSTLQAAQLTSLLLCYKSLSVGIPLLKLNVMRARSIIFASALATLAVTDPLDKPPLANNLDYLQKGLLQSLHPTQSWYTQWGPDWIPADCKGMTQDANMSAIDVEVFNVQYDDVGIGVRSAFSQINIITFFLSSVPQRPLDPLPAQRQPRSHPQHDRSLRSRSGPRTSMGPPHNQSTRS